MMPRLLLAAAVVMTLAAATTEAQPMCGPRDIFLLKLQQDFRERPAGIGLAGSGHVIELLTSGHGTWTLLVTSPNGVSCIVAAGDGWEWRQPVSDNPGT